VPRVKVRPTTDARKAVLTPTGAGTAFSWSGGAPCLTSGVPHSGW